MRHETGIIESATAKQKEQETMDKSEKEKYKGAMVRLTAGTMEVQFKDGTVMTAPIDGYEPPHELSPLGMVWFPSLGEYVPERLAKAEIVVPYADFYADESDVEGTADSDAEGDMPAEGAKSPPEAEGGAKGQLLDALGGKGAE